ncbi:MAG: periplasmic heavy metal sensor [Thermodesulfobacteriota bacterium]
MRISLLLVLFLFIFTLNTQALLNAKSNYKWWKDPKIAGDLDLSKGQVKSIERIFSSYRKRIIQYRKQLRKSEIELRKELRNHNAKKEEVLKLIDEIEDTKAAYTRTKIEMYLKVKDVLKPEQIKTLHEIKLRFKPYHR